MVLTSDPLPLILSQSDSLSLILSQSGLYSVCDHARCVISGTVLNASRTAWYEVIIRDSPRN